MPRARPTDGGRPVVWRLGVHLTGTPIWCDARRTRDLSFVSRADRLSGARHGQLIATGETLALLARRSRSPGAGSKDGGAARLARADRGAGMSGSQLAVPFGRPFSLGTLRLELFRAGSAVGAASLVVDTGERRVVYAGAVNPRGGGLSGAAEMRACDILVVSADQGDPRFALPPADSALGRLVQLADQVCAAGGALLLLCPGPLEGLELAHALGRAGVAARHRLIAHRSIHHAAQRLRAGGFTALELRRFGARPQPGQVLLWPAARRADLDRTPLPVRSLVALVSGDAVLPGAAAGARADLAVPWSTEADHPALLEYVEQSGARSIYLLGRYADVMAAELDARGLRAHPLGAPLQMSLFE
jgi:putative mRNA 3-end processing factor